MRGTHADRVQGMAFWASYPGTGDDLSATGLKGLSTYGSNDLVLDRENLNATLALLPPGTTVQVIEGGNHAQFGNYGPQPGDGTATISGGRSAGAGRRPDREPAAGRGRRVTRHPLFSLPQSPAPSQADARSGAGTESTPAASAGPRAAAHSGVSR